MIGPIQTYHRETCLTPVDREEPSDENLSSPAPFCRKTRITCGIGAGRRRGWTVAGTYSIRDSEKEAV